MGQILPQGWTYDHFIEKLKETDFGESLFQLR
jgi:hypothetical protein